MISRMQRRYASKIRHGASILSLYIFISLTILFLTIENKLFDDPHKQNPKQTSPLPKNTTRLSTRLIPPQNRRVSSLNCSKKKLCCLINNLYYIKNEFHVYVGENFDISEIPHLMDVRMMTGLGWGSHVFRFELDGDSRSVFADFTAASERTENNIGVVDNSTATILGSDTLDNNDPKKYDVLLEKTMEFLIHLHLDNPPQILPKTTKYILEPTAFFSVLWSNLFRTMYAGVGSWFTMTKYGIFFPDHHRFILLERTPKPEKFIPLLQSVTKFPVEWIEDVGDTIFRSATVGISRDVQVGEIISELQADEERFYLREIVFRKFCDRAKETILQGEEGTEHQLFHKVVKKVREVKKQSVIFASKKKSSGIRPAVSLILRDTNSRMVLNSDEIIAMLQEMPIDLSIYKFGNMNLQEQISAIDKTDVLITMHGAALTNILYMRQNTYVVELFPYAFKKLVYQNIAKIMQVGYQCWQNTHLSDTIQNFTTISQTRLTTMPKNRVVTLPIDWYNMDSKNYWRNQDTRVRIPELKNVIESALTHHKELNNPETDETKFLMFMPWEQVNNQLIALKSACAMSTILNRTLVIPHLGYRGPHSKKSFTQDTYIPYHATQFIWNKFDRYFDSSTLLNLPCKQITLDNFLSLNSRRSIEKIRYINLGKETTQTQVNEYYTHILHLPFTDIETNPNVYYQLTKAEIKKHYTSDLRVLALGALFWHYDFGAKQVFPLQQYYDYLGSFSPISTGLDPIYKQIARALEFSERIVTIGKMALKRLGGENDGGMPFVAIHVRRGDYREKCRDEWKFSKETAGRFFNNVEDACNTVNSFILASVSASYHPNDYPILYIATNEVNKRESFKDLLKANGGLWEKVIFLEDLIGIPFPDDKLEVVQVFEEAVGEKEDTIEAMKERIRIDDQTGPDEALVTADIDQLDMAFVDQFVCMNADAFVGNYRSSFSRHILEKRTLEGRSWKLF